MPKSLSRYIVVRPSYAMLWEVCDDDGLVCFRSASKAKCGAVAEFLQDPASFAYEGVKAWMERNTST